MTYYACPVLWPFEVRRLDGTHELVDTTTRFSWRYLTVLERYVRLYALLRGDEWNDYVRTLPPDVGMAEIISHFGYTPEELVNQLDAVIDQLEERYRQTIIYGFGLQGHEPLTLTGVGKIIGVKGATRPQQMQLAAVERLRGYLEYQELTRQNACVSADSPEAMKRMLAASIASLTLSARTYNRLTEAGFETVSELVERARRPRDLQKIRGIAQAGSQEILTALQMRHLL